MGYYIYHDKATLEKIRDCIPVRIYNDGTDDFDISLFKKYIQKAEFKISVGSIIIIDDWKNYIEEKARLKSSFVFHKSEHKLIQECISKNNFNHQFKEVSTGYSGRTILKFYKKELGHGIYYHTIFEHPFKDCCSEFYQKYPTGPIYTKEEVFQKACELEYEKWRFHSEQDFADMVKLFREKLIEQYEYGRSMLTYF
ncbi:MAG: hypothetical protein AB8F95_04525 [Bacteroidia bacterium]